MKKPMTLPPNEKILSAIEGPLERWSLRCHEASLAIVRSGVLGVPCRVARGLCAGVLGQHSWVVVGMDCYDSHAMIIDPTLWSYRKDVQGIWRGTRAQYQHSPHGMGNIFHWGKAGPPEGEVINLTTPLSFEAEKFLALFSDGEGLDMRAWSLLLHAPVGGWPAAEIHNAARDDPRLKDLAPIDLVGMLTLRNPGRLYLADGGEKK